MIGDTKEPATGAKPGEATGEAALIATFYGRRDRTPVRRLHERLYQSLASEPEHTTPPDKWENPAEGTFGRRFDPPGRAAHDTTAIQLALNAPGSATDAWKSMRQKLEHALDTGDLEDMWGYTLVYQAVLNRGVDADVAFEEVLSAVRRLHSPESLQPLAQADIPGGWVWLLAVPDQDDGLAAGTVYVALGPPEEEAALVDLFYGPAAELLAPDLIAHKGYYQMRQYRGGDLERRYGENLKYLQETTDDLLGDLEQRKVAADRLEELFRMYNRLLPVVSGLKELHVGLLQQLHNYDRWRGRVEGGAITEFHHDQLETAARELELKVEPLQHALETADKAVSVAQVQVDKDLEQAQKRTQRQIGQAEQAQESRQRRIEVILAAVASALALPELINQKAARALLGAARELLGRVGVVDMPRSPAGEQEPQGDILILLGTQAVIIVVVAAILIWLAAYFFEKRRGRGR